MKSILRIGWAVCLIVMVVALVVSIPLLLITGDVWFGVTFMASLCGLGAAYTDVYERGER